MQIITFNFIVPQSWHELSDNRYAMFISFLPIISPPTTNLANESRVKLAWTMQSAADIAGKKSRPYAFSNRAAIHVAIAS